VSAPPHREVHAWSCSPRALELLDGDARHATALEHGYVDVGDEVLWVSPSAEARSPLSIQADVVLDAGWHGRCGEGRLAIDGLELLKGPCFDPRPLVRVVPVVTTKIALDPAALVGIGPGLTPLGDDVWCGYAAGASLLGRDSGLHVPGLGLTTLVSRSLMARALHGELAEPAHALLTFGDLRPLQTWGSTSGAGVLLGLALAVARYEEPGTLGERVGGARIALPVLRWHGVVELRRYRAATPRVTPSPGRPLDGVRRAER